jgi:hypothetical protein
VRNKEVLHRVREDRNILHTITRRKGNWIGHSLHRNCLLKHIIEGKIGRWIEMTRRWGRRRTQLVEDINEIRGYCKFTEEALYHTMCRTCFGRGYGPVTRKSME